MGRREYQAPSGRPAPPDDTSGEVTVVLPARRAAGGRSWFLWSGLGRRGRPSRGAIGLLMLVPVTAGVLVASRLRPQGAERVNASVLSYVSRQASDANDAKDAKDAKDGVSGSTTDRAAGLAASALPVDPATAANATVATQAAPRCELPVVSVWELPVAREERPLSPWPVYHPPEPEASASAVESAPPRRGPRARPKGRRSTSASTSIDELVRKVNAADSKKKY